MDRQVRACPALFHSYSVLVSKLDPVQKAAQEQFSRRSEAYGKGHILQNVDDVKEALDSIPWRPGWRALDVAAGAGHTGLLLASLGMETTLADLSEAMLEQAQKAARERGLRIQARKHEAEKFPYPDGSFDLVSCRVAAHHFSSPEAFVRETARALKPGGWFLLIDGSVDDNQPQAEAWIHQVEKLRDPSHHRFLTPGRWRELASKAGLEIRVCRLDPFKQPDLEWYFQTAATPEANRDEVRRLVENAPDAAQRLFRIRRENGKIVWWWQRLTLIAVRSVSAVDPVTAA